MTLKQFALADDVTKDIGRLGRGDISLNLVLKIGVMSNLSKFLLGIALVGEYRRSHLDGVLPRLRCLFPTQAVISVASLASRALSPVSALTLIDHPMFSTLRTPHDSVATHAA
jgi:hypothetical protein